MSTQDMPVPNIQAKAKPVACDGGASGRVNAEASSAPGLKREVEVTVLMPCLNEARTLATCIRKAQDFLARSGIDGEVLVADNGSTDGSQVLARSCGARVVDVPVRGYGAALVHGIHAAAGRFVIMGDSDDSYDFTALEPFVDSLRAGNQLVMGNRFAGGIRPGAMPPLHRYLGNPVLSFIGRLFFRVPVRDFHCGLRGFNRESILGLGLRCDGMEFASEMVVKASLRGLRIAEVPTTLSPDGRDRPPHLRSWRDGWRHLRFLLLFSPRWLFLYPGLLLLVLGFAGQAYLLPGPRAVGGVTLDVHTMLFAAAAAIAGLQFVAIAVFAKVFAVEHEAGVVAGLVLVLLGLGLFGYALHAWEQVRFGAFDPSFGMRIAIPSITLMMVGVQLASSALYLGVLDLKVHARNR